jgi:hypothetical protein
MVRWGVISIIKASPKNSGGKPAERVRENIPSAHFQESLIAIRGHSEWRQRLGEKPG